MLVGVTVTAWIAVGGLVHGKDPATQGRLPLYTYNCTDELTTAATSYQTYATSTAADVTLNADTIE